MARTSASLYSPHPSIAMVQKSIALLKERTGRTLQEWVAFVEKAGPPDEAERREWLKREHKLSTNYAWWLAERAAGRGWEDDDPALYLKSAPKYVEAMYAGKKAALRPIHDALVALGRSLGRDVKVCPCQTMVPLYREHVFAQIKPATLKRIDFGLCLRGLPASKRIPARLIDTGGAKKNDRITHRFEITDLDEIDSMVKIWLKTAYELDAPAAGKGPR